MVVPTARFWLELHGSCAAWGDWLCRLYGAADGGGGGAGPELWFPNLGTVVAAADLERAEWFRGDTAPPLLRFDSWDELVREEGGQCGGGQLEMGPAMPQ